MNIKHPQLQDIPALRVLWHQAFGDSPAYLDDFFASAFSPERCLWADGGKAACYWLSCTCRGEKIAYLYAVATAFAARGQGFCRALMAQAKRTLASQGYGGILLVPASPGLRAMYTKMGFTDATCIDEFSVTAPAASASEALEKLTAQTYAQARKPRIPGDSAVEGPEFFSFLATQLEFYRWAGAVFACIREGDHLFIPEYLGNADALPEILSAFGAIHATVRTPGTGTKWAMYCPLSDAPAPTHFSFALD